MQITKLKQEDTSGSSQVISYKELNEFSGELITKYETRFYPDYNAILAIQHIMSLGGESSSLRKYKAIELLSECLYSGPNFEYAMKKRK